MMSLLSEKKTQNHYYILVNLWIQGTDFIGKNIVIINMRKNRVLLFYTNQDVYES